MPERWVGLQAGAPREPHVAKCGHAPQARREALASARLPHGGGETNQNRADQQQLGGIGQGVAERLRRAAGCRRRPRHDDGCGDRSRSSRGERSGTRRAPPRRRLEREGKTNRYRERGNQCREEQDTKPFPHDPHEYVTTDLDSSQTCGRQVDRSTGVVKLQVMCHEALTFAADHRNTAIPGTCVVKGTEMAASSAVHLVGKRGSTFHKLKTTPASWTVLRSTIAGSSRQINSAMQH